MSQAEGTKRNRSLKKLLGVGDVYVDVVSRLERVPNLDVSSKYLLFRPSGTKFVHIHAELACYVSSIHHDCACLKKHAHH